MLDGALFCTKLKQRAPIASESNKREKNIRGVCSLVIRYIVTMVERRLADLQGLATDATTHLPQNTTASSPLVTQGGKARILFSHSRKDSVSSVEHVGNFFPIILGSFGPFICTGHLQFSCSIVCCFDQFAKKIWVHF